MQVVIKHAGKKEQITYTVVVRNISFGIITTCCGAHCDGTLTTSQVLRSDNRNRKSFIMGEGKCCKKPSEQAYPAQTGHWGLASGRISSNINMFI